VTGQPYAISVSGWQGRLHRGARRCGRRDKRTPKTDRAYAPNAVALACSAKRTTQHRFHISVWL